MADAPPSYEQATGSRPSQLSRQTRNGLTPEQRRSLEDERRPLPEGWIRCWDPTNKHQFFVDTKQEPPRSIWTHPHDDQTYLNSLSSEERERIQELARHPSEADIVAESTDEEDQGHHGKHGLFHHGKDSKHEKRAHDNATHTQQSAATAGSSAAGASSAELPARPPQKEKFGRKLKDKLTGTTHDQRVQERARREAEEREMYRQQQHFRIAMSRAIETGRPQLLGRDHNGTDVYIEPPGAIIQDARGVSYQSPYASQGFYGPTIAGRAGQRFIRPEMQYSRPYGPGYGGGYGMGLPVLGGLTGGLLLGSLLF